MPNQIHKPLKRRVKEVLLATSDRLDDLCHVRSQVAPPKRLAAQYGDGNFFDVGLHFFQILLDHCGLQRHHAVLELGCGAGRIATPLSYYLSDRGRYEGLDIMPEGIAFAIETITKRRPNFHFQVADVYSSFYNPAGTQKAHEYRFPFEDQKFDVVYSTSLMTHLDPASARRYVEESARVLKSGGLMLHTFFVMDEAALGEVRAGKTPFAFQAMNGFYTTNPEYVEEAIALGSDQLEIMFARAQMRPQFLLGSWANRSNPLSAQDVVVAKKK